MLWQRFKRTVDGPGSPIDLRGIAGQRGRLHFAEHLGGDRMTSLPCLVKKVDRAAILLELASPEAAPQAESAVILEVPNEAALLQCFTTVSSRQPGIEVTLRTPARPHVVQRRRYPRIDVFLSIMVTLPDRPLEPIPAQMTNLSIDGAACVLSEPVPSGTRVALNLTGLGLHPPEALASVVRCLPTPNRLWVIGLKFTDLRPEQELYLGKYLSDFTDQPVF